MVTRAFCLLIFFYIKLVAYHFFAGYFAYYAGCASFAITKGHKILLFFGDQRTQANVALFCHSNISSRVRTHINGIYLDNSNLIK